MKFIILAGGTGTRFWPMSRRNQPKQFCRLLSDKTMLEETVHRFRRYPSKNIYIATTTNLVPQIKKIFPDFPVNNFIIEPLLRDTAPAMGYAAAILELDNPDEPIAFIPSDHYISDLDKFLHYLAEAEKVITETGKMLDISVHPMAPVTTLGYTKIGKLVKEKAGVEFYEFLEHKEKPDFETAKKYLLDGNHLWHANYYMWTPKKFLHAYQKHAPEMYNQLREIQKLIKDNKKTEIKKIYEQMEKISIDYAITEKMDKQDILIIKGNFGWSDIGTWDTLWENMLAHADEMNNVVMAKAINLDSSGCLVYANPDKVVVTIGIDDLVVVDTEDALLVCPKSRAQDVKKMVEKLKAEGLDKYL